MIAAAPRPRLDRAIAGLLLLAAAASLLLGVARLLGLQCSACMGGALSELLPWLGAAFYLSLAALAWRMTDSRLLGLAPGLYVLVHAALVTDMLLLQRPCAGCFIVAALALASAAGLAIRNRRDRAMAATAVLCGIVVGALSSYDRVDEFVTRVLWPTRMLDRVPAWVERADLEPCAHTSGVRLVTYEKNCKVCGSLESRLLPILEKRFGSRVCLHAHSLPLPKTRVRLPLIVMISKDMRVGVIEGAPSDEDLLEAIRKLVDLSSEPRAAGP